MLTRINTESKNRAGPYWRNNGLKVRQERWSEGQNLRTATSWVPIFEISFIKTSDSVLRSVAPVKQFSVSLPSLRRTFCLCPQKLRQEE